MTRSERPQLDKTEEDVVGVAVVEVEEKNKKKKYLRGSREEDHYWEWSAEKRGGER
jgi:hypothetical protein